MQVTPKDQATLVELYGTAKVERPAGRQAGDAAPAGAAPADTVELNDAAARVREARDHIRTLPDIREEKVAELRARIESGTYEIEPERVAAKMIRDALLEDSLS